MKDFRIRILPVIENVVNRHCIKSHAVRILKYRQVTQSHVLYNRLFCHSLVIIDTDKLLHNVTQRKNPGLSSDRPLVIQIHHTPVDDSIFGNYAVNFCTYHSNIVDQ